MRVAVALLGVLSACGFQISPGTATPGDDVPDDAPLDQEAPGDAAGDGPDLPADMALDTPPTRVTAGLVLMYTLNEGAGTTVGDTSGVAPALPVTMSNTSGATWSPDGYVSVTGDVVMQSAVATRVITACKAANAATLEAWITPAASQPNGFPRVVTLSQDDNNLGFALFGIGTHYELRLDGPTTDANGLPTNGGLLLRTADNTMTPNVRQHVVLTTAANGERRIYLDGVSVGMDTNGGALTDWKTTYKLVIGNETVGGGRHWLGRFHTVALYAKALSAAEVTQNFMAGPL